MTFAAALRTALVSVSLLGAGSAGAADQPVRAGVTITLPGLSYQVLGSGDPAGAHPTRADGVAMRYVGRLTDGAVFSTSPGDGAEVSAFSVKEVIPGMSAILQLMRPGDRWRVTMPAYLAYGPGRPYTAPPASGATSGAVQRRAIPPDATLVFDVELVAILPPKSP
jgi:FKBP-type peptidyl-prolyl cis-trans isomerase FklB